MLNPGLRGKSTEKILADVTESPTTTPKQLNHNTPAVPSSEVRECGISVWDLVTHDVVVYRMVCRTLCLPCATMIRVPTVVLMFGVVFGFGCMADRRVEVGV